MRKLRLLLVVVAAGFTTACNSGSSSPSPTPPPSPSPSPTPTPTPTPTPSPTPAPILSIFAGNGTESSMPESGPATATGLNTPIADAVDASGNVYIVNQGSGRQVSGQVLKVTPSGTLTVFAGNGIESSPVVGSATSSPLIPQSVATDESGNVYIGTGNLTFGSYVVKVNALGNLSIFAGNGNSPDVPVPGPATSSPLSSPNGLAVDGSGNVYVAEAGVSEPYVDPYVLKVTSGGILSIVAGNGIYGLVVPGPAESSPLGTVNGVAVDINNNVFIADETNNVIEKVTPSGTLSIFAGIIATTGAPTPGPAESSALYHPAGVAVDSFNNVYIADTFNNVVEKVTSSGILSIFAGTGISGYPTPGSAESSALNQPIDVATQANDVYIVDMGNQLVEKVIHNN